MFLLSFLPGSWWKVEIHICHGDIRNYFYFTGIGIKCQYEIPDLPETLYPVNERIMVHILHYILRYRNSQGSGGRKPAHPLLRILQNTAMHGIQSGRMPGSIRLTPVSVVSNSISKPIKVVPRRIGRGTFIKLK